MIDIGALQGHVVINGVDSATKGIKGLVEEMGRGGRSLSDFEKGIKVVGDSLEKLGKDLTMKVSLPIAGLGATAFKLASDFEETLSKTEAVFKDTGDVIKAWASDSIQSMGMAQATALDMASGFGAMGSSIGLAKEQTDTYAMSLTQLASDLSSFHNMSLEQVKTALNGIYTGETESIKQLGIAMTVTNLEAFALTQGITKQWKEMTQAEQVQLRYNYVMNATKDAQGDFARTSDSSANSLKILVESLKELGTTMGQEIVPYITPIVQNLTDLVQGFSELDEETKQNIVQFGLLAVATGPIAMGLGKVVGAVGGVLSACKSLSLFLSTNPYALAVAGITALIAGATTILVNYFTYADKIAEKTEQTAEKIELLKKGIYNTDDAKKEMESVEIVAMQYERLTEKLEKNEAEVIRLEGSYATLKEQLKNGTITQLEYNEAYNATSKSIEALQGENFGYRESLEDVRDQLIKTYGSEEKAIEYRNELARVTNEVVNPSLNAQQQQLVNVANTHATTGKAIVFNSSKQAQAEIDNIYATIKALEAKQKAIIAQAKADGAYEEEMRQAEASHTAIRQQIDLLNGYRDHVQTTYDALIVSEQELTAKKDEEGKKQTTSKKEKIKTEEELQEEALKRLQELQSEETKAIEDRYKTERDESEAHYKTEREAMEEAYKDHMTVLNQYCQDRYDALETEYNGEYGLLTGLNADLKAFDDEEKERKRQEKEQSYKDKIEKAQIELSKAESVEERIRAEEKLRDAEKAYKDYLFEEEKKAERQAIVDKINATKEEYAEKKKVIDEETKKLKEDAETAHKESLLQLETAHKDELASISTRLQNEKDLVIAYNEDELKLKKQQRDDVKRVNEETTRNNKSELEKQLADMKSLEAEMRQAGVNNAKAYQEGLNSLNNSISYNYNALRGGEIATQSRSVGMTTNNYSTNVDTGNLEGAINGLRNDVNNVLGAVKKMPQEQSRLNRQGAK